MKQPITCSECGDEVQVRETDQFETEKELILTCDCSTATTFTSLEAIGAPEQWRN